MNCVKSFVGLVSGATELYCIFAPAQFACAYISGVGGKQVICHSVSEADV